MSGPSAQCFLSHTPTMTGPPETLEGWYALHQVFGVPVDVARDAMAKERAANALGELSQPGEGWTVGVRLVGSRADVMLIHFRPTLDSISQAQRRVACESFFRKLTPIYSFLSVAEAGLYHLTAELARDAAARGGNVGDAEYRRAVDARAVSERASAHVQKRLFPVVPDDMPYVCFYPMSKRREERDNWYLLPLDERSRLMHAHGLIGRRYAGRVVQVITGAIGLDAWEWGVTLFARDPLDFKKLVTDMRFDEVSAKYAMFGDFYVGQLLPPADLIASL